MLLSEFNAQHAPRVIELFKTVFSNSEGEAEGNAIGELVSNLIAGTPEADIVGFTAMDGEDVIACIFFTRMTVAGDTTAFILSPVAVATQRQKEGVGKALILFGLEALGVKGVDLVFTYGDPDYYGRFGFSQLSESVVKAPFKLTYPEGWLVHSLSGTPVTAVKGTCQCVAALSDQAYW